MNFDWQIKKKALLFDLRDLIYNLIYPGILGSMIYDIATIENYYPINWSIVIFQWSILTYYLADYWHLYNVLDQHSKFKGAKNGFIYMLCDLIISVLLLVAFKFGHESPWSLVLIFFIPWIFLGYMIKRSYRLPFYFLFALGSSFLILYSLKDYFFAQESEFNILPYYIAFIVAIIYTIFVFLDELFGELNVRKDLYDSVSKLEKSIAELQEIIK